MNFNFKQSGLFLLTLLLLTPMSVFAVSLPLVTAMRVADTCGTDYGDHLASCQPFNCQRPNPLFSFNSPGEEQLRKMSPAERQKAEDYLADVEKKLEQMSPQKRAALKKKMVNFFEIKGPDPQGLCLTTTSMTAKSRQDCSLDETTRLSIADFDRRVAVVDSYKTKSSMEIRDGQMVTESSVTIDGKTMENPWQYALNSGQCKILHRSDDGLWAPVDMGRQQAEPAKSSAPTNTLFILDASGSMWGQIKGKAKITIAKEVMAKLVPELPRNNRIGLIAYGHRRKGDCNDVETLVKLGANNRQTVLDAVKGLNAKGKTPLTSSVNRAFKMLQGEKGESTIILVSDGIESCQGDPCKTVKAARKYGIKFVLNTIGFGLSKGESAQLECMAEAGGGQYSQADNADQLLKATRKAIQPNGFVQISATVNGKINDVLLRIIDRATKQLIHENVLPSPSGLRTPVPEGNYDVYVRPGGVSGAPEKLLADLKVTTGEVVAKSVSFDKGQLKLTVTINGQPAHALIHVEDSASHKGVYESSVFGTDTPVTIDLPAGKIDIEITAGEQQVVRAEGVEVLAGETTEKVIKLIDNSAELKEKGMEPNTNRWGMDYRDFTSEAADPALCQQACQKEQQCQSWTYVKQGNHCWLKSGLAPAAKDSCCVSGVK